MEPARPLPEEASDARVGPSPVRQALVSALLSASVVAVLAGAVLHRRNTEIEESIKLHFAGIAAADSSQRTWKERAVEELFGPLFIQIDRTERAMKRWTERNLYLEQKVIADANRTARDLLLTKPHLLPLDLRGDAGALIEHYDRWLEEFEKLRGPSSPALDAPFVFVGPAGYPFPRESADRFQERFRALWSELYGTDAADATAREPRAP